LCLHNKTAVNTDEIIINRIAEFLCQKKKKVQNPRARQNIKVGTEVTIDKQYAGKCLKPGCGTHK